MSSLQQKFENWRLSRHFKRVETILNKRDISHLSPTLQQTRKQYLDRLHDYAVRGIFPRNYKRLPYSPCFIDHDGRECAVAHLVLVAGQTKLANEITTAANYAYVPQMTFPELDNWAAQSGLTKEELALIQPGYWIDFSRELVLAALTVWAIGLGTILLNRIQVVRKHMKGLLSILSIFVVMLLMLSACYCLYGGWMAYAVGNDPEVPNIFAAQALRDAPPVTLLGLVSLVLAIVTGWVGLTRDMTPARKSKEDS
jgi:hypothetical protein